MQEQELFFCRVSIVVELISPYGGKTQCKLNYIVRCGSYKFQKFSYSNRNKLGLMEMMKEPSSNIYLKGNGNSVFTQE